MKDNINTIILNLISYIFFLIWNMQIFANLKISNAITNYIYVFSHMLNYM